MIELKETRKPLTGDIDKETNKVIYPPGDFRSKECVELLKEADIVVTNPPFSLFREYIAKLEENKKKYLLLGNQNAITYKEVFPLIKENKIWLGPSITSGGREYKVPDDSVISTKNFRIDENGGKFIRLSCTRWFTNLDHNKRHEELILYEKYDKDKYPKYDNYDAINVDKTKEIPEDYEGVMGVPISFMDKYCPEQFKIIGTSDNGIVPDEYKTTPGLSKEFVDDYYKAGGKGSYKEGNPTAGVYKNGVASMIYKRIFIRNKKPKIKKENE
jgi:hypothetical protein